MQGQPTFSVLITNYNSSNYIEGCLDSIFAQTFTDFEVVIVDDGSTDNSIAVIEAYQVSFPQIRLIKNDGNHGLGYTKRRCIEEALGEIIGFVDPDDEIAEDAILEMVNMHQQNPQASLIYSNMYFCDANLKVKGLKKIGQVPLRQHDFFNQDGFISHFMTFKKAAYLKTKGININLKRADDQDLYCKLYDVGEALLLDKPLYYYRIHSGGMSSMGNIDKAYFEKWKIIFARAEEKGIDIEQYFLQTFVRKVSVRHWLKIDQFIRNNAIYKFCRKLVN